MRVRYQWILDIFILPFCIVSNSVVRNFGGDTGKMVMFQVRWMPPILLKMLLSMSRRKSTTSPLEMISTGLWAFLWSMGLVSPTSTTCLFLCGRFATMDITQNTSVSPKFAHYLPFCVVEFYQTGRLSSVCLFKPP